MTEIYIWIVAYLIAYFAVGLLMRRRYLSDLTRIDPPPFGFIIGAWPMLLFLEGAVDVHSEGDGA